METDVVKQPRNFEPKSLRRLDGRTFHSNGSKKGLIKYYQCSDPVCHATAWRCTECVAEPKCPEDQCICKSLKRGTLGHDSKCYIKYIDEEIKLREYVKEKLKTAWWHFLELYEDACTKFPKGAETVSLVTLRSSMKHWRLQTFPRSPETLEEFAEQLLDGLYSNPLNYDEHELTALPIEDRDGCVHILFYDKQLLEQYFKDVSHLFVDATFQTRPKIKDCVQLLNVLGGYAGRTFVLFFGLMSRRTTAAYTAMFSAMKSVHSMTKLQVIMSDFEAPERLGLTRVFEGVQLVGCNVHFDRAIYRKLKDLGVTSEMNNSERLTFIVKKILALAFLPADMIENQYHAQKQEVEDDEEFKEILKPFFEYFERYWIRIITPAGFSVYGLSCRSNNVTEGFNSALKYALTNRPAPCDFLFKLVLLIVQLRRNLKQDENLAKVTRLPRYQSVYKQEKLFDAWRSLNNKTWTVEYFINAVAKLKGDIKERLEEECKNVRVEDELRETPAIVPQLEDTDFDAIILKTPLQIMTEASIKRAQRKMAKLQASQPNVAHIYRQPIRRCGRHIDDEAVAPPVSKAKKRRRIAPIEESDSEHNASDNDDREIDENAGSTIGMINTTKRRKIAATNESESNNDTSHMATDKTIESALGMKGELLDNLVTDCQDSNTASASDCEVPQKNNDNVSIVSEDAEEECDYFDNDPGLSEPSASASESQSSDKNDAESRPFRNDESQPESQPDSDASECSGFEETSFELRLESDEEDIPQQIPTPTCSDSVEVSDLMSILEESDQSVTKSIAVTNEMPKLAIVDKENTGIEREKRKRMNNKRRRRLYALSLLQENEQNSSKNEGQNSK